MSRYTLKGGGGLPTFLTNAFKANCRQQLLNVIDGFSLLDEQTLSRAVAESGLLPDAV